MSKFILFSNRFLYKQPLLSFVGHINALSKKRKQELKTTSYEQAEYMTHFSPIIKRARRSWVFYALFTRVKQKKLYKDKVDVII